MNENVIEIDHISKSYKLYEKPIDRMYEALGIKDIKKPNNFYALKDVSFCIKKGETVGIIGVNGSGKSTILKIITGVLQQTSGEIFTKGRISALLELGAGFNMEYTGMDNIYLNGMLLGYSKDEIEMKIPEILSFADIGDFIYQPVKTYSSGMFIRLAFAVSINIDPDILIVDEALSVGDVFFQTKCYKKFDEFKKKGKTILLVTHDLSSVLRYCDRAILINKGVKVQEGTPKNVVDLYKKVLAGCENEDEKDVEDKKINTRRLLQINPSFSEYGNKKAEIEDYFIKDEQGVITNTILKNTTFRIGVKFKIYEKLVDPLIAFTIKDQKGNEITGTNTRLENIDLALLEINKSYTIIFEQKMNLQGGDYLLSFGCTGFENSGLSVYHRLYDVTHIRTISTKDSVGFYDMNSKIKLIK